MAGIDYNLIPDKINNFNAYKGTATNENRLLGTTNEVQLPEWELMSEMLNLAGFAGELDSPTEGQLKSAQIEIGFSNASSQMMALVEDDTEPIVLRGAQEFIDKETSTKVMKNRTITIKGMTKSFNMGSLKVGGYGSPSIKKEVTYYKDVIDGEVVTEIDKINFRYVVNGVDKGAQINEMI